MVVKAESPVSKSRKKKSAKESVTRSTKKAGNSTVIDERINPADEFAEFSESLISREERLSMIAEAAYYRAEQRGFDSGGHEHDWLEAEKSVDKMLSEAASKANY